MGREEKGREGRVYDEGWDERENEGPGLSKRTERTGRRAEVSEQKATASGPPRDSLRSP